MENQQKISTSMVFKKMLDGVWPYRFLFVVGFSLLFLGQIVSVFVPILYKNFFDILNKGSSTSTPDLMHIIYLVLFIHALNWLFWRVGILAYSFMQAKVMAKLRQNAFDYVMLHSYNFFANNFTGSIVQRIGRFSRAFENLSDTLVYSIVPLVVMVSGAVIVTWIEKPIFSVFIFLWVMSISIFNIFYFRWKMKYDEAVAEADSRTTAILSDDITNQNALALFTGYDYERKFFKEVTDDQAKKTILSWQLSDVLDTVHVLFMYGVEFFIFYYAVILWQKGAITLGIFVLVQIYIISLGYQLWGIGRIVRNIYGSLADSKQMVEILNTSYEIKDIPRAKTLVVKKGEIEFKDVTFNFNQTRKVLDNINAVIPAGQKIALAGHSGAGKTTFVRTILRLYDLTSGRISIDGQDISKMTQDSLRLNVSLVPQDPVLFHRTLMENIRYGKRDATDEKVFEAARLAHCDDFIDDLPLRYETFVGERGIKLSGGERQRVAIARAILKNAPIIIFDEATSSLDSHSEALIQDALDTLMKGRTTIIIAHRLSTIRKMDRIIVMEDGRVIEDGTHDKLIAKDGGTYQKLWNLQVSGFIQE